MYHVYNDYINQFNNHYWALNQTNLNNFQYASQKNLLFDNRNYDARPINLALNGNLVNSNYELTRNNQSNSRISKHNSINNISNNNNNYYQNYYLNNNNNLNTTNNSKNNISNSIGSNLNGYYMTNDNTQNYYQNNNNNLRRSSFYYYNNNDNYAYNDIYANIRKNQSDTSMSASTEENSSEYSEFDLAELNNLLRNRELDEETIKRLERNQNCLTLLVEGDLIEYIDNENEIEDRDYARKWALYMGNSMIMRFDERLKTIVYESYWKIADRYYIFINRDYDKRLYTLPIYEILNKARSSYANRATFSKKFSSDKNFAMWCRFDINKSDLDSATENNWGYSKEAKDFIIKRFLDSLDQAEDKFVKIDPKSPIESSIKTNNNKNQNSNAATTTTTNNAQFYYYDNKNLLHHKSF